MLLHKLPAIPALKPESSRQALIHLAQVLQRDNLPTIIPVPPSTLQQLPPKPFTDIISKGDEKQNTTLTTFSPSNTSTIIPITNITSNGERTPLANTSTRIDTSSQQTLDDLVLQYRKLDKMNAVSPLMVKKLPPLLPHVKDNFVKYNTPCPKGESRIKQPPLARLLLNHLHFTRSKPYSVGASTKVGQLKNSLHNIWLPNFSHF